MELDWPCRFTGYTPSTGSRRCELKASQSTIADPSKGLFYQSTFDTQKTDLSHMDVLLQFAKDSGFNRIYFSLLGQTEEEPSRLPAFRLHAAQEKDLADLSYLTSQLEENRISLSLVLDPFSLSPSHPAYRFVKTAVDHGSSIAVWDGERLQLDPAQDQNLALAQWDLQKLLAAGSIADEIVLLHTAFLSPGQNGQVNSPGFPSAENGFFFRRNQWWRAVCFCVI